MPTTIPTTLVFPAIEHSEVEAARRFLTAGTGQEHRSRPAGKAGTSSCPTVRHGIARARNRSAAKAAE